MLRFEVTVHKAHHAFHALVRGSQRARHYVEEYEAGRLSLAAKRIMDSLVRESPQYTRGLRAECFMLEPSRTREFERAMAEHDSIARRLATAKKPL